MQDSLCGAGLTSLWFWCLLSLPLEFVACGGGLVGASTWSEGVCQVCWLGAFMKCRAKSASACVLPGITWHDLQRDLQMSATYAEIAVSEARPSYEPRPTAIIAKPGDT